MILYSSRAAGRQKRNTSTNCDFQSEMHVIARRCLVCPFQRT